MAYAPPACSRRVNIAKCTVRFIDPTQRLQRARDANVSVKRAFSTGDPNYAAPATSAAAVAVAR